MSTSTNDSPIEDYLDDLLRRTSGDARTTRRLLDEASDHLFSTAAQLEATGLSRPDAERAAVDRFGPAREVTRGAWACSFAALVLETLRAAVFLLGCCLVAIGVSGLVALGMNLAFGRAFVGGVSVYPFGSSSINETADDAVVLRVLAGVVGLVVLLGHYIWRRRTRTAAVLPPGLVDALGAAAFAAGTVGLAIVCAQQAIQNGADGVGFPLSGAVVALPATLYFCARATRALIRPNVSQPPGLTTAR